MQYDFVALIQQGDDPTDASSICTGSLIASSTVLTAGHCCFTNSAGSDSNDPVGYINTAFQILLGAYTINGDEFTEAQTTPLAQRSVLLELNGSTTGCIYSMGRKPWKLVRLGWILWCPKIG